MQGKLVALPWFTDAGLLYYRHDLLEQYGADVPQTWQALTDTARRIQNAEREAGNERMHGFVFQGRAYEGLTTNALEWVASYGSGTFVDAEGQVTVNNPQAVEALALAASWVGDISPEGVRNYMEEQARGVFQAGNAVFMRNWPYVWSLGQADGTPIQNKFSVAPLPSGPEGESVATLGGWNWAVSRYSDEPQAAADLVAYLTAEAQQKAHAIEFGRNPTRPALYEDEGVLAAQPFIGELYETVMNGVPRPASITGDAIRGSPTRSSTACTMRCPAVSRRSRRCSSWIASWRDWGGVAGSADCSAACAFSAFRPRFLYNQGPTG